MKGGLEVSWIDITYEYSMFPKLTVRKRQEDCKIWPLPCCATHRREKMRCDTL